MLAGVSWPDYAPVRSYLPYGIRGTSLINKSLAWHWPVLPETSRFLLLRWWQTPPDYPSGLGQPMAAWLLHLKLDLHYLPSFINLVLPAMHTWSEYLSFAMTKGGKRPAFFLGDYSCRRTQRDRSEGINSEIKMVYWCVPEQGLLTTRDCKLSVFIAWTCR